MNNALWKAMCRALHEANANGEPLTPTPEHMQVSGPCPHCKGTIEPADLSTLSGSQNKDAEVIGLIVCGGCCEVLMYRQGGAFEPLPKKMRKHMSKSTLGFIERSQELIRASKRQVN